MSELLKPCPVKAIVTYANRNELHAACSTCPNLVPANPAAELVKRFVALADSRYTGVPPSAQDERLKALAVEALAWMKAQNSAHGAKGGE